MTATECSGVSAGDAGQPEEGSSQRPWWRYMPGVVLFFMAGIGFAWLVAQLWPGGGDDEGGIERRDLGSLVTEGDVPVDPDVLVELVVPVEAATGRTFVSPPIVVGQSDDGRRADGLGRYRRRSAGRDRCRCGRRHCLRTVPALSRTAGRPGDALATTARFVASGQGARRCAGVPAAVC